MAHPKHKKMMKSPYKKRMKGKVVRTSAKRTASNMKKAAAYKAMNRGKQGYREDQQKRDMGQTRTGKYYAKQGRKASMKRLLGAMSYMGSRPKKKRKTPSSGGTRPSSGDSAYREIIGMISGGGGK